MGEASTTMSRTANKRWTVAAEISIVAVLLAACGSVTTTAPSAAGAVISTTPAMPATAPSSPTPSPTFDPEAVRKTAAAAYLVAAETANTGFKALDQQYKPFRTVAEVAAYGAAAAKIEQAFVSAVNKIAMPPEASGDVWSLVITANEAEGTDEVWSEYLPTDPPLDAYWLTRLDLTNWGDGPQAASNRVRADIGLPPVSDGR
jgi:hypothetical protein